METVTVSRDDLLAVLDYAQPDEERDYERDGQEAGERHVVHVMRRLREAATGPVEVAGRVKRYALVRNAASRQQAEAYLPSNYEVVWSGEWSDPALPTPREYHVVAGYDSHGWTLDDYVIPRYASGNIHAWEIDLSHPVMKGVPA